MSESQPQVLIIYKSYTPKQKEHIKRYFDANKEKIKAYNRERYKNLPEEKKQAIIQKNAEASRRRRERKKANGDSLSQLD